MEPARMDVNKAFVFIGWESVCGRSLGGRRGGCSMTRFRFQGMNGNIYFTKSAKYFRRRIRAPAGSGGSSANQVLEPLYGRSTIFRSGAFAGCFLGCAGNFLGFLLSFFFRSVTNALHRESRVPAFFPLRLSARWMPCAVGKFASPRWRKFRRLKIAVLRCVIARFRSGNSTALTTRCTRAFCAKFGNAKRPYPGRLEALRQVDGSGPILDETGSFLDEIPPPPSCNFHLGDRPPTGRKSRI